MDGEGGPQVMHARLVAGAVMACDSRHAAKSLKALAKSEVLDRSAVSGQKEVRALDLLSGRGNHIPSQSRVQVWKLFGYEKYQETGRATESEDRETRALDEHIKNLPKGQMEILMTDDTRGTLHSLLHVRAPADVTIPNFEPVLHPRLKHSKDVSPGANLRFKSTEAALTSRFPRRARAGRIA